MENTMSSMILAILPARTASACRSGNRTLGLFFLIVNAKEFIPTPPKSLHEISIGCSKQLIFF